MGISEDKKVIYVWGETYIRDEDTNKGDKLIKFAPFVSTKED
jgi:hypothetical protein